MLLTGLLASIMFFLLFAALAFVLGLFWWHIWRLSNALLFLTPVFGVAFLTLFLSFALHMFAGQTVIGLTFSLILLAFLYLVRQKLPFKKVGIIFFLMTLTYLLLVLPFLLVNGWIVTGYNVNNDPVFHNIMAEQFYSDGYKISNVNDGKTAALKDKIEQQGYPDSFHHLLGLAAKTMGMRSYRLFNFAEFFFLSLLAAVVYALLTTWTTPRHPLFITVVAATSYLQLTYSFQGYAPQVAVTPFLFAGIGLIYLLATSKEESGRLWPSLSLVFAAGLGVFSFSAFFWWSIYVLVLFSWLAYKKESLRQIAILLVLAFVVALILNPFAAKNLPKTMAMANTFSSALGILLSPKVPLLPVFSSWLAADHRLVPQGPFFYPSLVGVFLGVLGLLVAGLKLRHPFLNLTFFSFFITLFILKFRAGPYYFAKSLQPFSVFVVTMALLGLLAQAQLKQGSRLLHLLFILALTVYVGLILLSGLIAFKFTSPAPQAAFHELESINKRYGLKNDWLLFISSREDWGRYLLSNFKVVSPQAIAHNGLNVSRWSYLNNGRADLDSFKIDFSRFKYLVIAKAQDQSLASPLYRQIYAGKYYNVYVRKYSHSVLQRHLPLEIKDQSGASTPYLKLQPGQELMLNIKPAKFVSVLAKTANGLPKTNINRLNKSSLLLVSLGTKKQQVQVGSVFKLFQISTPVATRTISFKNNGNQVVELDWLELLKKPYPEQLIIKYNQYLKQRRVAID